MPVKGLARYRRVQIAIDKGWNNYMIQKGKVFATNPDDMSLNPGMYRVD